MFIPEIGLFDSLLSLVYIGVILFLLLLNRPDKSKLYNRFFVPFVFWKILSAIVFVLLHIYVYQGGDTFVYFQGGKYFAKHLIDSPIVGIQMLLSSNNDLAEFPYDSFFNIYYFFRSSDVFFMSKITSFFCLISFNQYLTASIIFSLFSSYGIWKLYQTFCMIFPQLYKYFALGTLFYPAIAIWGSGILKDSLTLSAIGIMFFAFYRLYQRKNLIRVILLLIIGVYICLKLKPYLLYIFIPSMLFWGQSKISEGVRNPVFKYLITPFLIALFVAGGFFLLRTISESAGKYSLDNVQHVAEGFHSWHTHLAEERNQSGYTLGQIEFTPTGILQKLPEALFVTYYRPFIIGDIRNFATAFEGIQSFFLLIVSLIVIFRVGLLKFIRYAMLDTNVRAFLIFAIILGAAVGLTSYNFGALSRYKIPCLPFFTAALSIIYYKGYIIANKQFDSPSSSIDAKKRFVST